VGELSKTEYCKIVERTAWFVLSELRPFQSYLLDWEDVVAELLLQFLRSYEKMKTLTPEHLKRIVVLRGKNDIPRLVRRYNLRGRALPKRPKADGLRMAQAAPPSIMDTTDEDRRAQREETEFLRSVLSKVAFTTQEDQVLVLFLRGLTLREIGARLGVSESRVCQVMASVKRKARKELEWDSRTR
jgi:RNA polymerase sigma factor (sigma-70 family)